MRNAVFMLVMMVFLAVYGSLNFYIGIRGWKYLGRYIPFLNSKVYWVIFAFLAFSYLIARMLENHVPFAAHRVITMVGAYWVAAFYYLILILVFVDIIRLLNRLFKFIPEKVSAIPWLPPAAGLTVLLLVLGILIYGTWNAGNPRVTSYEVPIAKSAGDLKQLRAVMVSDVHLGTIVQNGRLRQMVSMINELNPDVVLLSGDIFDEDVEPSEEEYMIRLFRQIKSKYGVYAALGNHEYIGGHLQAVLRYMEEGGIEVLRDRYVKIADSFYVVGRDDRSARRFSGQGRKELSAVMEGVDRSLPVILLDHQPSTLEESLAQGVDLQVSGHTHRGQLFPNHLITRRIYEIDWGYLKKENLHVIVSSGYGTWGPPIRTGNYPEVVDVLIKFQ